MREDNESKPSEFPRCRGGSRGALEGTHDHAAGRRAVPAPYIKDGQPRGNYPYCLPAEYADHNLLPDVRQAALQMFSAEGVRWHADIDGHPSNHLLDSQVQCVNALAPGMSDPDFVKAALGDVLPIEHVLEIESGRTLTFEFIGERDHLNEGRGAPRTRGSMTTSADAAIRYCTPSDTVEVALIEWKFTEDYRGKELTTPRTP